MCGITGVISVSGNPAHYLKSVSAMTGAVQHRGPDDGSVNILRAAEPVVVFGQRRLAIIDLSEAGKQPMLDPDTGNWLSFNGEIYNFQELRAELQEKWGYRFRTGTDSEVILKAFDRWGRDCVRHFRGIFAFAVWQEADPTRLFLARDHLGVKPLYYWQDRDTLLFASEVRALLASGEVPRKLNPAGLRSYLAYGSVQEPLTLVQGVESLPPGHTLLWENGRLDTEQYWNLAQSAPPEAGASKTQIYEEVQHWLLEAVKSQLIADVPLGVFLSGGIDSSAIAALAQQSSARPIRTFSIIFEEAEYDERRFAQAAARHIGSDHSELLLTGELVQREIGRALGAFDQPSVDGINTYFVSKLVREAGLTVALSGVGGDELFGGYNGFRKALLLEKLAKSGEMLPGFMRSGLSRLFATAGSSGSLYKALKRARNERQALSLVEGMRKTADLLQSSYAPYFVSRQLFSNGQVSELLRPDFLAASNGWEPPDFERLSKETRPLDSINRVSALELQTYMLSTLLRDTDQMSMAHALEVRVPLLDHKLVENVFKLSGALKVDKAIPKPLLTGAVGDAIPAECVYRPKKGFELPFNKWLTSALQPQMEEKFLTKSAYPVLENSSLAKYWDQFLTGQLKWSRLWSLFVLLHWLDEHHIEP